MPVDWCLWSICDCIVRPSRSDSRSYGWQGGWLLKSYCIEKLPSEARQRACRCASRNPGVQGEAGGWRRWSFPKSWHSPVSSPDECSKCSLGEWPCHQIWVPYYLKSFPGGHVKEAGIYIFPSEKEKNFNFVYRSLSAGGLPFQSCFNMWKCSCVLQRDPGGGCQGNWDFAIPWVFCTKAALSVNSSSPNPTAFRSQVALLMVVHSCQHFGFVRRLHPLILSCYSPKQLIKRRQKA